MRRVVNLCLAGLLCAFLLTPTGWASPAEVKYEEGLEFFKRGDYKAAIVAFTKCIESLPDKASGYGCFSARGSAKNNIGLYDDAIVDANEAIKRYGADYVSGYYVRGYGYMAKKEYDKSIEDLQKALLAVHSSNNNLLKYIHRKLGRSYYGKELYEPTIINLQKAIKLDAQLEGANWWLGNAFEKSGKTDEARKAYENFIRYAKPNDSRIEMARQRIKILPKP